MFGLDSLAHWVKGLPDKEAAFWGSVIGAAISTLGAFGIGLLAIFLERRYHKRQEQRRDIRKHGEKIVELEIFLNQYLQTLIKNERLLRKCTELKTPGHFMMTLPRVMPFSLMQEADIINKQLLDETVSLELAISLNNQLVEDFAKNYRELAEFLMPLLAQKQSKALDQKMISEQHAGLLDFAESARKSTNDTYERSLKVMAIVHLNGERSKKKKFKKIKDLEAFKVEDEAITAKVEELRQTYSEPAMFDDI